MRVAFVDHYYHKVTRSTQFLKEQVLAGCDITEFWDESWADKPVEGLIAEVLAGDFDLILVFQAEHTVRRLALAADDRTRARIVFVPMWDGCQSLGEEYWRDLAGVRIVSFSRTLHERVSRYGLASFHTRYFPDPAPIPSVAGLPDAAAFLWWRVEAIGWPQMRRVFGDWRPDRVHLHIAPDPQVDRAPLATPTEAEAAAFHITTSTWFEDAAEFRRTLFGSNIFFAPRLSEGIGMATLEAMAAGMCVVAHDAPTMNEYIISEVNGLLADFHAPEPLDLAGHRRMGARARDFAAAGYAAWKAGIPLLRDFILAPPGAAGRARFTALRHRSEGQPRPMPRSAARPLVTIATVVRDDPEGLALTIANVARQDHDVLEYIVLDGGSGPATLEVIRRNEAHLSRWISERDLGPYDAMNRAARMAAGDYLLFMNAGDWFAGPDAVSRAFRAVPEEADFVIGNHLYRVGESEEQLHQAEDFDRTWARLRDGPVDAMWLQGIPGHQATFTRTALLRSLRYDCRYRICADHEFLYRARAQGARFFHCLETVSVYNAGGMSDRNRLRLFDEWAELGERYGGAAAQAFFQEIRAAAHRSPPAPAEAAAAEAPPEAASWAEAEIAALQEQLAARGADVARLEAEIARIRGSASWILTYPLRWTMRRSGVLRAAWSRVPLPGRGRRP